MSNSALGSQSIALLQLPSGMLIDFAGTVEPQGWLMCDGRAVSRTTFSSLFASIGTAYGVGDGSTTFNLPDFRGRFARYNDNMGTAQGAASRDTGRVHGTDQTQATAKNGINATASSSSISGTVSGLKSQSTSYGYTYPVTNASRWNDITSGGGSNSSVSGTANAQIITVSSTDSETRPINLACNKLIKI